MLTARLTELHGLAVAASALLDAGLASDAKPIAHRLRDALAEALDGMRDGADVVSLADARRERRR